MMWDHYHDMLKRIQELPEYKEMDAPQHMAALFHNVHLSTIFWFVYAEKTFMLS